MTSACYPSYLNDKSFFKKRTGEEIAVTNMPLDEPYKRAQIEAAIKQSTGYASLSFIANKSKVGRKDARNILLSDRRFRKSLIIASNGDEVFMLNTNFSAIRDAWNTFRHLNFVKY
jgi:hypothetical protein